MKFVTKIVNEYNDIVSKLTPAEVRNGCNDARRLLRMWPRFISEPHMTRFRKDGGGGRKFTLHVCVAFFVNVLRP